MSLFIQNSVFYINYYNFDHDLVGGVIVAWDSDNEGVPYLTPANRTIHSIENIAGIVSEISQDLYIPEMREIHVYSQGGVFATDQYLPDLFAVDANDIREYNAPFAFRPLTYGRGDNSGSLLHQGLIRERERVPEIGDFISRETSEDGNLIVTFRYKQPTITTTPNTDSTWPTTPEQSVAMGRFLHFNRLVRIPDAQSDAIAMTLAPLAEAANAVFRHEHYVCDYCITPNGIGLPRLCDACGKIQILCQACHRANFCVYCSPNPTTTKKEIIVVLECSVEDFDGNIALEL